MTNYANGGLLGEVTGELVAPSSTVFHPDPPIPPIDAIKILQRSRMRQREPDPEIASHDSSATTDQGVTSTGQAATSTGQAATSTAQAVASRGETITRIQPAVTIPPSTRAAPYWPMGGAAETPQRVAPQAIAPIKDRDVELELGKEPVKRIDPPQLREVDDTTHLATHLAEARFEAFADPAVISSGGPVLAQRSADRVVSEIPPSRVHESREEQMRAPVARVVSSPPNRIFDEADRDAEPTSLILELLTKARQLLVSALKEWWQA